MFTHVMMAKQVHIFILKHYNDYSNVHVKPTFFKIAKYTMFPFSKMWVFIFSLTYRPTVEDQPLHDFDIITLQFIHSTSKRNTRL